MDPLSQLLDASEARVRSGRGTEAVAGLCEALTALRRSVDPAGWSDAVKRCREHPLHALVMEDPYTRRAFEKPRGYAGDAELLDFVYSGTPPLGTSEFGKAVFAGTTRGPNGRSVVHRRELLAQRIDQVASERAQPRIASIACGHLREAQRSAAVAEGAIAEFIAFDQDPLSLKVVEAELGRFHVRPLNGSVTAIVRKKVVFENLDFVYAAGLLDYLSDELSRRLIALLFDMLRPGGRLLVANFLPANHGRDYMECFMDWTLICRDDDAMRSLLRDCAPAAISDPQVFHDPDGNIVYLEATRR